MTRKALLLTIGAAALSSVTPIIPVTTTDTVDAHTAPALPAPTSLTVAPMLDAGHLAWAYAGPDGVNFVVQIAADVAGSPGGWAIVGQTTALQYLLALPGGVRWVRVYAELNGRNSAGSNEVLVTPVDGLLVTGTATALASLQDDVTVIDGTLTAHATDLVNLDARADVLESDVGGLQTETTALAAADTALDARVTVTEGSITSQSSQLTSLSSSITVNRSVAGRTPLVFRQAAAPTISGTRYNKLLRTTLLSDAVWVKTAAVAASTVADPEGFLQAWRITPSADGQYVRQDVTALGRIGADLPAIGRTFTYSVWLRADTAHDATIRLIAGTAGTTETLDVAVTNTFQRFNITKAYAAETETALRIEIYPKKLGVAGAPNHFIDVALPQLQEGALSAYQRVGVAIDYDGNGIPLLSQWYETDNGNFLRTWDGDSWEATDDGRTQANANATSALDIRVTSAEDALSTQASDISALEVAMPGKASVSAVSALDVRIDATEAGVTSYYAAYTLTLDVNGKISGFKSVNDGAVSLFEVQADIFKVGKQGGGDALTWESGVLTALKGSYSVKIGAGFGSSSNLVFWYGADGSTATRTIANAKVAITSGGNYKLGSTQLNYGSGWSSGAAITYSSNAGTPATATISVTSGVFRFGDQQISYNAGSVNVTGTNSTTVKYFLYYDDPGFAGGSQTLVASTSGVDTFNSDGRVLVGACAVTYPASGGGSGGGSGGSGGGGNCPQVDMWVLTPGGPMRAGDVRVGDQLLLCDPDSREECWGEVSYSERKPAEGVRLIGDAGVVLECSTTAPIPTDRGYLVAPETLGRSTLARRARGIAPQTIATVEPLGRIDAQHITVGDRCFWTGADPDNLLLHHNLKMLDP